MSTKAIRILLGIWLFLIITFVGHNNSNYQHIWNLGYYISYDIIVFIAFVLGWISFKDKLVRSLLLGVALFYCYHVIIQVIEIFNPELKKIIYRGKYINWGLSAVVVAVPVYQLVNQLIKEGWKKARKRIFMKN